ncbi:triose-phosphate isomerase [Lactobacillus pasteurii DSM 23907 = CRBIP 24.76]|nr:triose-phosphate isomerase [Lactobacillus pasteurii DSM 23907 = CRBIP 24.76]
MNPEQTVEFVNAVKSKLPDASKVESAICAPAVDLDALRKAAEGSNLHIGAENAYFEVEGAFTGETSPKVLNEMGIHYCIIGHSERRGYFHETDEDINKKAKALFANNVTPILCCGESLETREANKQEEWVVGQIKADLEGLTAEQVSSLVIAYEPIWAIGTGKTATADQAEEMCKTIRETIKDLYDEETAENVRIQYGGSVKPANVKEIMAKPNIDGGLIGGAALDPESYLALVNYQD